MAKVHSEAQSSFFDSNLSILNDISLFIRDFDITWARNFEGFGTSVVAILLKPDKHIAEAFELDKEIVLFYSIFDNFEPRSIRLAEKAMMSSELSGRIEDLVYIFVSSAVNIEENIRMHVSSGSPSKVIVPFSIKSLKENKSDYWYVRETIRRHFYMRDFFSDSLPITSDALFFGRANYYTEMVQSLKRGENIGLFGLRKTGKTSLLNKVKRILSDGEDEIILFYDCKIPFIRKSRWFELLESIYSDARGLDIGIGLHADWSERMAAKSFYDFAADLADSNKKLYIIFDEVEYISFLAKQDQHWQHDFVDFWQTIWSTQSRYNSVSFILAGVNPLVVEKDVINGIQNPLFGIVKPKYLTGLEIDELRIMTQRFGKRMGMKFDDPLIRKIYENYGGHPKLSRLVFSNINALTPDISRPKNITLDTYNKLKHDIDGEVSFYSQHVISELEEFYPSEYSMLKMLATNQVVDFHFLSKNPVLTNHLVNYGLIKRSGASWVKAIPVIFDYINQKDGNYIVEPNDRENWLEQRKNQIINEMRNLESAIARQNAQTTIHLPQLFGINSFPEADRIVGINVASDNQSFMYFINSLNRSFVESIEQFGKSLGKNNYFWGDIKLAYPKLWKELDVIKTYRNDMDHLKLNDTVTEKLSTLLEEHLGKKYTKGQDISYFILQQRILDSFLISIREQTEEISR